MRFIELFAGIGGFRYGLEAVKSGAVIQGAERRSVQSNGIESDSESGNNEQSKARRDRVEQQPKDFTCVYANEIDKYAAQIYRARFGEGELYEGDIRTIQAERIPDHDLLVGGFPCQAFSIAGKRGGFEDTRGTLFFEIARILSVKRPKLLLLENVKGLLSHDNGNTFGTILSTLSELGYFLEWQVLNSKDFGVPQNRERVFIVGHLGGGSGREVFPVGETPRIFQNSSIQSRQELTKKYPQTEDKRNVESVRQSTDGQGCCTKEIRTNKPNPRSERDKSNSPNSIKRTSYSSDMRIRRLTPTECERLQGFPDGWTEGLSDTQRYKCLGNAVTTNVITAIGERIVSL